MTRNGRLLAIAFAICLGFSPVFAGAPAGLRNKTIHVSYVEATPRRGADGKEAIGSRTVSRAIYVSSLGRAFTKRTDWGGKRGRAQSLGQAAPEYTSRNYRFEGSRLIITSAAGEHGAQQLTINFDSGFQTCSMDVKTGSSGGARTWNNFHGERMTATGPTSISNTSCSIQNGNEFAQ